MKKNRLQLKKLHVPHPLSAIEQAVVGCIIGGAIGDAVGAPHENTTATMHPVPTVQYTTTDDTALVLATCSSITATRTISPANIASTFLEWFRKRRIIRPGSATLQALRSLDVGAHWALAGKTGEYAAGNGAAMRVAPLAFFLVPSNPQHRTLLRDVVRITHNNDEAYAAALALLIAVRQAWHARAVHLPDIIAILPDSHTRDALHNACAIQQYPLPDILQRVGTSGFAAESVPAALCAAQYALREGMENALQHIICAGGDTDTIASMMGNIVGAAIGYDNLPLSFLPRIPDIAPVLDSAKAFARVVHSQQEIWHSTRST